MTAYYNEHDPYAAEWLRRLILNGHIAPGDVDESDIRDIRPDDLKGYTQCHFFAGIGVWSHALRRAGWPDDRPIWTGSCPCQPFSAAGARAGFADERHLWPAFNHLIGECSPATVVGEQVENAGDWLDLVSADLEAQGYAFGAAFLPAAGFGGAHIRSRNYWLAHACDKSQGGRGVFGPGKGNSAGAGATCERFAGFCPDGGLVDGEQPRLEGHAGHGDRGDEPGRIGANAARPVAAAGCTGGVDNTAGARHAGAQQDAKGDPRNEARLRVLGAGCGPDALDDGRRTRAPMLGRNPADWLFCRDGKWRPVGPGASPLVDAAPARVGRLRAIDTQSPSRVGRLRAYGNALDAETAVNFLLTCRDTIDAANA